MKNTASVWPESQVPLIFVECPSERKRPFIRGVRAQGCSLHTPGIPQNTSGPCRDSPKERRFRRQTINLAPPERFRAWENGHLRLEEIPSLDAWHECCFLGILVRQPCLAWIRPRDQVTRTDPFNEKHGRRETQLACDPSMNSWPSLVRELAIHWKQTIQLSYL